MINKINNKLMEDPNLMLHKTIAEFALSLLKTPKKERTKEWHKRNDSAAKILNSLSQHQQQNNIERKLDKILNTLYI